MRDGPRRFTQDFSCPALLRDRLDSTGMVSRKGLSPAAAALSNAFRYPSGIVSATALQPRARRQRHRRGLGSCAFARRYLRNHCYFLFLRVLRCFSSPRSPRRPFTAGDGLAPAGFPHSDIRGSQGICPSPRLFAACHVLRRLREPQASPVRPTFAFFRSLTFVLRSSSLSLKLSFSRFVFAFPTCQ